MANKRARVALVALQLALGSAIATVSVAAAPARAQDDVGGPAVLSDCGNGRVDLGEQCDGVDDSGCPGTCNALCECPPVTTINIPSSAAPPNTPGSPGVTVTNEKLLTQFGPDLNLNNARYTRFQLDDADVQPDAIIILIPASSAARRTSAILAQNLLVREKADHNLRLEVWAFDRRTNQLEDTVGLDIAESTLDALLAGNWLFGEELSLPLDPRLDRRAVFYNTQDDVPFMANWTNLVFSRDIDAVVEAGAQQGAQRQCVPRRAFRRHRLHRALRLDQLRHHQCVQRRAAAGLQESARPGAARRRRRVDRRRRSERRRSRPHHRQVRRRPLRRRARQRTALRRWHDALYGQHRGDRLRRTDAAEVHAADGRLRVGAAGAQSARARDFGNDRHPERARPQRRAGRRPARSRRAGQQRHRQGAGHRRPGGDSALDGRGRLRHLPQQERKHRPRAAVPRHVGRPAGADHRRHPDLEGHPARSARSRARSRTGADHAARRQVGRRQGSHAPRSRAVVVLRRRDELLRLVLSQCRPEHDDRPQPRLDETVGAAAARPRPLRHRESHRGGQDRRPGHRVLRQRRSRHCPRCVYAVRAEHRHLHRTQLRQEHPARRQRREPESGVSDLRRRRGRVRGLRQRGLRAPGRADGRGQRGQSRRRSAVRLHRAQLGADTGADLRRRLRSHRLGDDQRARARRQHRARFHAARSVQRLRLQRRWQRQRRLPHRRRQQRGEGLRRTIATRSDDHTRRRCGARFLRRRHAPLPRHPVCRAAGRHSALASARTGRAVDGRAGGGHLAAELSAGRQPARPGQHDGGLPLSQRVDARPRADDASAGHGLAARRRQHHRLVRRLRSAQRRRPLLRRPRAGRRARRRRRQRELPARRARLLRAMQRWPPRMPPIPSPAIRACSISAPRSSGCARTSPHSGATRTT